MHNRVVRDYFDIDWQRVWNTVKDDFPPLLEKSKSPFLDLSMHALLNI